MVEQLEDRTVPSGGPVSLWAADGNANDAVGGNNGTLQGGVTFAPGVTGQAGDQAFNFDGSTGSVVVPDAPSLDFTQTFTLSAWVNPSAFMQDPAQGGIISKVGGDAGNMGYQLYITGGNTRVGFQFNSPGQPWPGYQLFANAPVPPNQWTLITASYDQSDMKIYVDGTLAASRFIGPTAVATSGANFRISGDDNSNVHFAGLIDEVAVFNRALSAKEVQDLYNGVTVSVPASQTATAVAPRALVANSALLVSTLLSPGLQAVPAAPAAGPAAPSASLANPSGVLLMLDRAAAVSVKAADVVFAASATAGYDDNGGLFAPFALRGLGAL